MRIARCGRVGYNRRCRLWTCGLLGVAAAACGSSGAVAGASDGWMLALSISIDQAVVLRPAAQELSVPGNGLTAAAAAAAAEQQQSSSSKGCHDHQLLCLSAHRWPRVGARPRHGRVVCRRHHPVESTLYPALPGKGASTRERSTPSTPW